MIYYGSFVLRVAHAARPLEVQSTQYNGRSVILWLATFHVVQGIGARRRMVTSCCGFHFPVGGNPCHAGSSWTRGPAAPAGRHLKLSCVAATGSSL